MLLVEDSAVEIDACSYGGLCSEARQFRASLASSEDLLEDRGSAEAVVGSGLSGSHHLLSLVRAETRYPISCKLCPVSCCL